MSRRHRLLTLAAAAVVTLTTAAACGSDSNDETPATEQPLVDVVYLTGFGTFGRDAYAHVALEQGFFADAGFNVEIRPGTGTVDVMTLVASGQADYGVADLGAMVTTLAGEDLPVRAVAAVHQRSLVAIASLDGRIDSPEKLEGASVADSPASTVGVLFPAYASAAGIDPDGVEWVPSAPQTLPQLLASGSVDGIGQFVVGQALLEKAASGQTVTMLPYADHLPDLYGIGLIAATDRIEQDPDQVSRFTGALLQGLEYALDNPEQAAQILAEHDPTQDEAVAAAELTAMEPYVRVAGTPVGQLDRDRIDRMIELFTSTGTLASTPSADDMAAYDLVPSP